MNLVLFSLLMSFSCLNSHAEGASTKLSAPKEINGTDGAKKDISLFLENVKRYMKIIPMQLEETGNEICDEHMQIYRENLQNAEPWALKMVDASSKILDGVFEGHMLNLGNFEECISVNVPDNMFKGKYCLGLISVGINTSIYEFLKYMDWPAYPSQYFKSEHSVMFGPQVAICLPSSCTGRDLGIASNKYLRKNNVSAVMFTVESYCSTNEYESLDVSDWVVIGILCCFVMIAVFSTYYDIKTKHSENRKDILLSFSVYTNGKKLISSKCDQYLHNLHGIRFITSIWIMLAHVHMSIMSGTSNIIRGFELLEEWQKLIISNSFLSVDTFLMLSGILLSFSFLNAHRNKKLKDFNLPLFYFARYIRLTPVLAFLIMFSATIMRHLGSGPLWNNGIKESSTPCRENWWIPLLYIQNYMNSNTCITQSWYLAVDFQMYIFSPILLILLWKKPRIGIIVHVLLVFIGMGIIFGIAFVYKEHMSHIEMARDVFGTEGIGGDALDTAFSRNRLFVKTHARFAPWVIGIILGYILHRCKDKTIILKKISVVAGWIIGAFLMLVSVIYGHRLLLLGYEYNVWECSTYLALHRVTWSIGVSWVIFACATGYGGIVNWFLSLKFWLPLSRLVYSMYLMHSFVLQIMRLSAVDSRNATAIDTITTLLSLFLVSTVVSAIVSLMFESPFIAILNILFKGGGRKNIKASEPKKQDNPQDS